MKLFPLDTYLVFRRVVTILLYTSLASLTVGLDVELHYLPCEHVETIFAIALDAGRDRELLKDGLVVMDSNRFLALLDRFQLHHRVLARLALSKLDHARLARLGARVDLDAAPLKRRKYVGP